MAKHNHIRQALDYIRQGYSQDDPPFRFTVSDLSDAIGTSEKKTRDVLRAINNRARFWRGDFPASGENFIVSTPVYERLSGWFS